MSVPEKRTEQPRLLIVSDQSESRDYLQACLDGAGFQITIAHDQQAGLSSVKSVEPEAVLLDLSSLDGDGLAFCRALRRDPGTRSVVVILLNSSAEEQNIKQAFDAGADDYVVKPFRKLELIARIGVRVRKQSEIQGNQKGAVPPEPGVGTPAREEIRSPSGLSDSGVPAAHGLFFDHLPDGVVLLDEQRRTVFANPKALEMIGREANEVVGQKFLETLDPHTGYFIHGLLQNLGPACCTSEGTVSLIRPDGSSVQVSARTSLPLGPKRRIFLHLRDQSEEQRVANELRRTKNFLENLINSSVDAIIAADLKGKIILFNKGAEQILGYRAEDVIERMHVADLYPAGVAREIMHQLRQDRNGGPGRLTSTRKEAFSASGEVVPIQMTAWIVEEDGREVATAGIFHDLRGRLQIERKLSQAQEKLMKTEKQAMIAELAGATAHELNQPLTSVLGYAELAKRKLANAEEARRIMDIIIAETERMAEIVRKIGHLTRYETKSYVGQQRIVDLDRSSEPE